MRKVFLSFVIAVMVAAPLSAAHAGSITCSLEHKLGVDNVKECESQP